MNITTTPARDLESGTRIVASDLPRTALRVETVHKVTVDEATGYALIWTVEGSIFPRPVEAAVITPATEDEWARVTEALSVTAPLAA